MKKLAYTALMTGAVALMSSGAMAAGGDEYTQNRDMYRQQSQSQSLSQMEPAAGGEQLSSAKVSQLQQKLQQQGFDPGPVDGILGQQTRQAIRQFQQAHNLDATGQLDNETATQLGMAGASEATAGEGFSALEPAAGGEQLRSSDVLRLQQTLQQRGFDPGPVDGVWGQQTRQAIREFQQANNLDATGQLDRETATQLGMADALGTGQQQDWQRQQPGSNMPGGDTRIDRPDNMRSPGAGMGTTDQGAGGTMGGGSGY